MTDFRFKRLERFRSGGTKDRTEFKFLLPQTPTGKVYRWCPNEDCSPRLFLLGDSIEPQKPDRSKINRDPGSPYTTCPYCKTESADDDFSYEGDIDAITKYFEWAVPNDITDHLKRITRDFNRAHRTGGLFSIKMDVKTDYTPEPKAWREDLIRNLSCDVCGREYGVYAIALFCPDCGSKNLNIHFEREIELILQQIDIAEQVAESGNNELSYRILGNAHEDVVTAFETYQKVFYKYKILKSKQKDEAREMISKNNIGNGFQNVEKAKRLYKNLSIDPFLVLISSDLKSITLNLEKRHIIGHNLSMIDEAYSDESEKDKPGTTVNILAEEIAEFATTSQKLMVELERLL